MSIQQNLNLKELLQKVRDTKPLVHNITNYVVMNNTANALLALGASPVMAHAETEVVDMVNIAGALVINIGTLSDPWIRAMGAAMGRARERSIPYAVGTKKTTEVSIKPLLHNCGRLEENYSKSTKRIYPAITRQ